MSNSVEDTIRLLQEQATEVEQDFVLTEEDLDLLSEEEIAQLAEHADQLDELSKATLGSYIKKAVNNTRKHAIDYGDKSAQSDEIDRFTNRLGGLGTKARESMKDSAGVNFSHREKDKEKLIKRNSGITRAVSKLTKEDLDEMNEDQIKELIENLDQLDEVSRSTLTQFVGSFTDNKDTDVGSAHTKKIKAKQSEQDKTELKNTAKESDAPEGKDYNIKKDVAFEKGDQTEVFEDIDLGNLFEGQELTEDFKTKATTIFESAVSARVSQLVEAKQEELAEQASEELDSLVEGLIDKVDGFLSYIAEQWIQKNELALENGIKAEMFESFMYGMKNLFSEHYVNVPEEELDILEAMQEKIEVLENQLDESVESNVALSGTLKEIQKEMQIEEACEGLSEIQAEKFRSLVENISYENEETFSEKLEVIRENYFTTTESKNDAQSFMTNEPVEQLTEETQIQISPDMKRYLNALNQQ